MSIHLTNFAIVNIADTSSMFGLCQWLIMNVFKKNFRVKMTSMQVIAIPQVQDTVFSPLALILPPQKIKDAHSSDRFCHTCICLFTALMRSSIHLFHNGGPIKYYFVLMLISLSSFTAMRRIQKNMLAKMRPVSPIYINTIKYQIGRHL